uniref:Uncharacterized protein n=1 Tax=Brassica oleracea TaxID=3712 RepID=A0A3P6C967_BRAOL|nr:unnamed protein product [Brassica oleracea]
MLEEEWLQFAMSETPLTCPHKKNNVVGRDTYAPTLNCLLPETSINKGAYRGNGESSQAVRRRLFDGPIVPSNRAVEVDDHTNAQGETIEAQTVGGLSGVAPPSSVYTWTRFQDTLHDLLNDESSEPVLFTPDAPPVIDSGEEDGTYCGRIYYNCK